MPEFRGVLRVEPLDGEAREQEIIIAEGEGLLLKLREPVDEKGIDKIVENVAQFMAGQQSALIFSHDIDVFVLKRKGDPQAEPAPVCWLCGGNDPEPDIVITVERETPGGEPCRPKDVPVHTGCYQDLDA